MLFAMQRTHWCYLELTIVTRFVPTLMLLQQSDFSLWSIWLLVLCLDAAELITTDFTRNNLHWQLIQQRVYFKIFSMVFKAQHDLSPIYITEMMKPTSMNPRRQDLRSASRCDLSSRSTELSLLNMPSSSRAQWPGIGFHRQSVKRHRLQHSVVYWKHICLRLLTQTVDYVQCYCGVRSLERYINTHFKLK